MAVSTPLWLDSDYHPRSALDSRQTTDIAIVGGGITGISAALHLAQMGYPPVLLERDTIASGASGRNAGFLIAGSVEFYHRAIGFVGHRKAKRLWELSLESHHILRNWITDDGIECDYQNRGSLVLAATESEWEEIQEAARALRSDGFNAEVVRQGTLRQWGEPLTRFLGGYYCLDDGGVNPACCIRGLAEIAERSGAKIYENSPVIHLRETKENTVIVKTPHGNVEAKFVLIAGNAYTPQLDGILDGKVLPVRGQMLATGSIDKVIDIPCYANFGFDYFRQLPNGRFLLGGSRDIDPDSELGFDETPNPKIQDGLDGYLMELLNLNELRAITHRWTGTMGFARDGLPIVGRLPQSSRIFVAAGFTGHGMSIAPKVAEIASTLLIEGQHPDAGLFSIRRFLN
ncbi:MAG: FAD-binding oxidoreductase [Candidatus Marinimicrobia bacterium]|nr:FAD-binding oxidoreductase [Candidatus Neomarinimicrobiota bacterium]MCF7829903.1 FAD-binding oxidoreductase [Candidatus Neomarinimicrobiota bacterium]MCF7879134.1 FAD-binding oxidoreductase [Candidatus Neomarinimicrobiota bacterium]